MNQIPTATLPVVRGDGPYELFVPITDESGPSPITRLDEWLAGAGQGAQVRAQFRPSVTSREFLSIPAGDVGLTELTGGGGPVMGALLILSPEITAQFEPGMVGEIELRRPGAVDTLLRVVVELQLDVTR